MKIFLTDKAITKLNNIIQTGKPDSISMRKYKKDDNESNVFKGIKLTTEHKIRHKTGNRYEIYINKNRIKEIKKLIEERTEEYKNGGIFPFLIPLLAGLGAVGSLAGGAAGIAKTVMTSKGNDEKIEEEKRHNLE